MKIKTSELKGKALDWAVRHAVLAESSSMPAGADIASLSKSYGISAYESPKYAKIGNFWAHCQGCLGIGDTEQEAIFRALVQHKLGDEVDVPDEFAEGV